MVSKRIGVKEFLVHSDTGQMIDTRSPSEFARGHIPGAINIPLFTDTERTEVGRLYKKKGRMAAVLEGLRAVGPDLDKKLAAAVNASVGNKLLLYCWRGGMRSESLAYLFSLAGLHIEVLDGGYKAYRNYILENLSVRRNTIILGGMTGSGKTSVLQELLKRGEQVVDLEAIASHRGSAFGALGQGSQPATEHFANRLFNFWSKFDLSRNIWLEDESRNIGSVFIPEIFWKNMQESPVIALISEPAIRLPRLVSEYCTFPPEMLADSVRRISRRLGGDRTKETIEAIDSGDFYKAAEIALAYYDKAYMYSLNQRPEGQVVRIKTTTDDPVENASAVIDCARKEGLLPSV